MNHLCVSDITYIGISDGRFAYGAVILDAWSPKLVRYFRGRPTDSG